MFFKTCSFYVGHCFGRGERAWGSLRLHSFPWQRLSFLASVIGLGNRGGCAGAGLGISNPVKTGEEVSYAGAVITFVVAMQLTAPALLP